MERFKVAMGQMRVEPGRPVENMERAENMIRSAGRAGCRLIVLPECLDVGWTHPSARQLASPIPGERSESLLAAARDAGIFVVAGLTERFDEEIYNSAVLLSPDGRIVLRHRKINELDIATSLYATGTGLGVAHTPIGTVGLAICADNFPESLVFGHSLARMGA